MATGRPIRRISGEAGFPLDEWLGSIPAVRQVLEDGLDLLGARFGEPGFYVLDEPEAALSLRGSLALVGVLQEIGAGRTTQAIVATHSPIVAAAPGATIFEVGPWGIRESA